MSYFGGPAFVAKNYHSYNPESVPLKNIGLSSYTRNSLQRFGLSYDPQGKPVLDQEINEYFNRSLAGQKPRMLGDGLNGSILHYDKQYSRYITRTTSGTGETNLFYTPSGQLCGTVLEFQNLWDKYQEEEITSNLEKRKIEHVYQNIKNSLSGCITFNTNVSILGGSYNTVFRIYFESPGFSRNDNQVANKGVPTYVVPPKNAALSPYANSATSQAPPGQSIPTNPLDTSDPNNNVAAEPEYRYNAVDGKLEFGTFQIVARLLEDLDGISVDVLPENVDAAGPDQYKIKNPPTAPALAMMAHNGNPREFTSNSFRCDNTEKEKITVVNITPRSYKRGEMVLCSRLDGMWVPMGYQAPREVPSRVPFVWSQIQKYIVDWNGFFKSSTGDNLLPSNYESNVRDFFYEGTFLTQLGAQDISQAGHELNKLKAINSLGAIWTKQSLSEVIPNSNTGQLEHLILFATSNANSKSSKNKFPSKYYRDFYDADVLSRSLGGSREKTFLAFTNIDDVPSDGGSTIPNYLTTFAFGVYSQDGYTKQSVARTKLKNGRSHIMLGLGASFASFGVFNFEESSFFPINKGNRSKYNSNEIDIGGYLSPISEEDFNWKHFPLQLAIHSSENPIINSDTMMDVLDLTARNSILFADYISRYSSLKTPEDTSKVTAENANWFSKYALSKTGNLDAFNLTMVSSNRLQFNPLGTYSILSGLQFDVIPPENAGTIGGMNIKKIWSHFSSYVNPLGSLLGDKPGIVFGARFPIINLAGSFGIKNTIPFGSSRFFNRTQTAGLRLFRQISSLPELKGDIGLFRDGEEGKNGAYVFGIVAMRGTFVGSGGLSFTTNNKWGYGAIMKNFTDTSTSVTIIPLSPPVALATPVGGVSPDDKVFYGSVNNAINEVGTMKLVAKVYDHCENVVYDGRYFTPFFFNPNDKSMDFENIVNPVGTPVVKNTKLTRKISTIRRNKMLNLYGFSYIKKVVGPQQSSIRFKVDPEFGILNGGGYAIGDKIVFGSGDDAAVFEIQQVGPQGEIINPTDPNSLKLVQVGNLSESAFVVPLESTTQAQDDTTIVNPAVLELHRGVVMETLQCDLPPTQHGNTTILSLDDNAGYGQTKGWNYGSLKTAINFVQSDANLDGKYDLYLFFVNDAGNYLENNSGGADSQLPLEPFHQSISLEINGI